MTQAELTYAVVESVVVLAVVVFVVDSVMAKQQKIPLSNISYKSLTFLTPKYQQNNKKSFQVRKDKEIDDQFLKQSLG